MQKQEHILMVHLVSNGDCLMATTIARQIKQDFPDCHLTWAISYKCKQVILNNPFVDDIWEVVYEEPDSPFDTVWFRLKKEISQKNFDKVFYTQIYPENEHVYDGTTRSSTFRTYPGKITVPIDPVIRLYDNEVEHVKDFVAHNKINTYTHKIIFECTPSSGQSEMNLDLALNISKLLTEKMDSLVVIISTHKDFSPPNNRIINGAKLSYRENAELSKYCTFLIGCSSGISWLLTSDQSKKLPSLQILNRKAFGFRFASMCYDFKYWGLSTEHIIETDVCELQNTAKMVLEALTNFQDTRKKFHLKFKPNHDYCISLMLTYFLNEKQGSAFAIFKNFTGRNGFKLSILIKFAYYATRLKLGSLLRNKKK